VADRTDVQTVGFGVVAVAAEFAVMEVARLALAGLQGGFTLPTRAETHGHSDLFGEAAPLVAHAGLVNFQGSSSGAHTSEMNRPVGAYSERNLDTAGPTSPAWRRSTRS